MNVNRLESVRPLEAMVIEATYSGGQKVRVDMTEIAARLKVFAPLTDRTVFEQVGVADWGH
ncbi:MAG: hypothetical protein FWH56_10455, partial [Betaproteobacteria bacterium]|nr:hypothetical protein [Betaproteobacteria bacterium]